MMNTHMLFAQDPVYSHFMFNQLYFNPAFAGNTPYPRLISGYRNQWPGLGKAYVDYYASFDMYADAVGGGVGLGISRDVQGDGIYSKSAFDVMYSYPVEISRNITANLGLQGGLVQKRLNADKVILGDQNPYETSATQEIIQSASKIYPDFSAGVSFLIKEQYQVNFSVHHINRPNEMLGTDYTYNSPMRFTVQAFTQFPRKKAGVGRPHQPNIILRPGIMTQLQPSYHFFGWGSNFLISSFTGGLWFRNSTSMKQNTIILLAGYTHLGLSLYYSYDYWMPGGQNKNYGAHEVTFIYLFQYNDPKKKMKPIKCPKF
jgi:type IX secretion system PorP/SprF family membrane protein